MKPRQACRLLTATSVVIVVFLQAALAAPTEEKPGGGQDELPLWANVSKEQRDEARKLGLPVAFTNSLGMRFALITPGTFQMGSAESAEQVRANCIGTRANPNWANDEHPRHNVRLSRAFYMSIHEVTDQQFEAVEQSKVVAAGEKKTRRRKPPQMPVEVSWDEAVSCCQQLSKLENRPYRLPTEAEWEYACRSGTTTPFFFGETICTNEARYNWRRAYGPTGKAVPNADINAGTAIVGSFPPNAWGLYDMHGNVWEWCWDWHGEYQKGDQTDPKGPSSGKERIVRGGAWCHSPAVCRSAMRGSYNPEWTANTGFRVVVETPPVAP